MSWSPTDTVTIPAQEHLAHRWLGSLSMACAMALRDPRDARKDLSRTLEEFMASGVASEELCEMLRDEMRGAR